MSAAQRNLIAVNVLGGLAVLGSYVWGFVWHPDTVSALWGGVPESLRPLYTVNMFLAAGGYFLFAPYIVFRMDPEKTRMAGFGYGVFAPLFLLVLVPSALWMPLTFAILESPGLALWWTVRVDLFAVGLGSLGLLAGLLALEPPRPRGRVLAVIGLVPFVVQTALLDALVWPAYFELP